MSGELSRAIYVDAYVVDPELAKVRQVESIMQERLSREQMHDLRDALESVFLDTGETSHQDNEYYIELFISAKSVENCSKRTTTYYRDTLDTALGHIGRPVRRIDANDIRGVLAWYMGERGCSPVTVNNVRRVLSTFFQWLENEDYIRKSPVKKTRAVRTEKSDKLPFSDMEVAMLREVCVRDRDRAIVEMLLSSGMRVAELCGLNRSNVDLTGRECSVLGKGNKRRMCYFSAEAAMYAAKYLESRTDDEPAMFTSLNSPYRRLSVGAVENLVRKIGRSAGVANTHPHRFRRTFATNSLRRGMKIEEIQQLLGHENIETTMIYAKVDKDMLKEKAKRLT